MRTLTLTSRLVLLLTLPLLGVTTFGIFGAWEKWQNTREYARLRASNAVLGQIGELVHELQKERGRSAVFVGSKGAKFAAELPVQQQATDATHARLRELLATFDARVFGAEFAGLFKRALAAIDELPAKRDTIRALRLTAPESTTYFTSTITALLDVIVDLSHHVSDAEIANGISSYVSFIQAKEQTGIERAVLSGVFTADKFAGESYQRFSTALAAQQTYLRVFAGLATAA